MGVVIPFPEMILLDHARRTKSLPMSRELRFSYAMIVVSPKNKIYISYQARLVGDIIKAVLMCFVL